MDKVKILARGNLPLPPVLCAVLLSHLKGLFVRLLAAAFARGEPPVMARPVREIVVGSLFGQTKSIPTMAH
jgi:hypothetical protein